MHAEVTRKDLRFFGLIVGGIFAVIALWPLIWRGDNIRLWAMVAAGVLIIPGIVFPMSLKWLYRGWMAIGALLGFINTRIILGIIFYGIFAPVGLFMRLRGKDVMRRNWEPEAETYRVRREPRAGSHMQHQF